MVMKKTFNVFFKLGEYLVKGYTLKKEDGARFASKDEQQNNFFL
jgi:hypothetical protein